MTQNIAKPDPPKKESPKTSPPKQGFIPWGDMMRVGLRLGLTPYGFWSLSLKEWRWLTASAGGTNLSGDALAGLMAAFPDRASNPKHETYENKEVAQ